MNLHREQWIAKQHKHEAKKSTLPENSGQKGYHRYDDQLYIIFVPPQNQFQQKMFPAVSVHMQAQ